MAAIELYNTPLFTDANLTAYWRLEGNSNDSKDSNNGTDTNMTYGASYGKFGQGGNFATNSYSNWTTNIPVTSIVWWMYPTTLSDFMVSFTSSHIISIQSTNKLAIYNTSSYVTSTTVVDANTWNHFALTLTATNTYSIYKNGVFSETLNIGINGINLQQMGRDGFYAGYMDDIAIFSRILTATEISKLYNGTWQRTVGSLLTMYR